MKEAITILHLSDFHFGGDNAKQALKASDDFMSSLKNGKFGIKKGTVDFIVVTGDLTTGGRMDGFVSAAKFLKELSHYLNVKKGNIIISPGNHDVNLVDKDPWNNFINFYQKFYGKKNCPNFKELKETNESFRDSIKFADIRISTHGILFVVFNSAINMKDIKDKDVQGKIGSDTEKIYC